MSRTTRRVTLMSLVCLVQLAVPASMLVRHELTLARGEPFRFRCAPVDPADPFRGRYVELAFDVPPLDVAPGTFLPGERVFVRVERGPDGFAAVRDPSAEPPGEGAYLAVRLARLGQDRRRVLLPFDRFYMTESLAPEAERAYRERVGRDGAGSWAQVRILRGRAVLEDLYLDGRPVAELLAAEAEGQVSP